MAQLCPPVVVRVSFCQLLFLPGLVVALCEDPNWALSPKTPLDKSLRAVADFALSEYNQASDSKFFFKVLRIFKAEAEVYRPSGGFVYCLSVELVNTVCEKKKGLNKRLEDCELPLVEDQQKEICEFEIWAKTWLRNMWIKQKSCKPSIS